MQQRGLHLWELDMSRVSGGEKKKRRGWERREGTTTTCEKQQKVVLRPPLVLLPASLFCIPFLSQGVKWDLRELQYLTDSEDPFPICARSFKSRQELPFNETNRCSTANAAPASGIPAPPPPLPA